MGRRNAAGKGNLMGATGTASVRTAFTASFIMRAVPTARDLIL
jgi:hypothetical protein